MNIYGVSAKRENLEKRKSVCVLSGLVVRKIEKKKFEKFWLRNEPQGT